MSSIAGSGSGGGRGATALQKLRMRQNKLFRRIEGDIKEKEKKRRSNRGD